MKEVLLNTVTQEKYNPLQFTLVDKDTTVKVVFETLPAGSYKVILQQPSGGTISFVISGANGKEYGPSGSTVTLSNQPASGYIFKNYTATDADGKAVSITDSTFTLSDKNVTVSGVFEKLADKTVTELIAAGQNALKNGNVSVAINAYESAYAKDNTNTEALVYSTLGKLASIAWSNEVGTFFKNRLGLKLYPSTLDALIDPQRWFDYYPDKDRADYYYDSTLGEYLSWVEREDYTGWWNDARFTDYYPNGDGYYYPGPCKFVSGDWKYDNNNNPQDSYYDEDVGIWINWIKREDYSWMSDAEFTELYPNGDGYYSHRTYIFVSNVPHYDSTSQPPLNVPDWIKAKTPYTDTLVAINGEKVASSETWAIILIANLIDKNTTGLNAALDDAIKAVFENPNYTEAVSRTAKLKGIDPVKLDAELVQALGLSEFFGDGAAYAGWAELELLLSALKLVKATLLYVDSYNWDYDIGFVKDLPWDETALDSLNAGNLNKVLPLRTGFMTARGGSYLEDSSKAYVEAFTSIISIYEYYTGEDSKLPAGIKAELAKYTEYKELVVQAKNAIDTKGQFTVDIPELGDITINFGKFFTSGQLALDKLIETEGTGNAKSPVFYGWNGTSVTKITAFDDLKKYGLIGFKINTQPIADIVGKDLADGLSSFLGSSVNGDNYLFFDSTYGKIAWAAYHWDENSKDLISGLF
ncbi:hypothetical protein Holit_00944 [Hollandina sp. SP2]